MQLARMITDLLCPTLTRHVFSLTIITDRSVIMRRFLKLPGSWQQREKQSSVS